MSRPRWTAPERYSLTIYSDEYGPDFETFAEMLVWWAAKGTLKHPGVMVCNVNACDIDHNGLTEEEQEVYDRVRETGAIPCDLDNREHAMVYEGPGDHGSDYRCERCGLWIEAA
jgi:hypothetical protein